MKNIIVIINIIVMSSFINFVLSAITENSYDNSVEFTTISNHKHQNVADISDKITDDINLHINYATNDQIRQETLHIKNKGNSNEEIIVKGKYFVLGSENHHRHFVNFVADKDGYRALVNYMIKYDGGYYNNTL